MIAAGIWPIFSLFRKPEPIPTTAAAARAEHAQLQCFAEKVLRSTPAGATIRFVVPNEFADGGLIDHRLRYVLPERSVVTQSTGGATAGQSHHYVAIWRGGCDGVLTRQ